MVPGPEMVGIFDSATISRILVFLSISLGLIAEIRDSRFPVPGECGVWVFGYRFQVGVKHSTLVVNHVNLGAVSGVQGVKDF